MNYLHFFSLSGAINFIGALILAVYVLSKNPHSRINFRFSIMNVFIAIWSFGYIFWPLSTIPIKVLFWFRFLHLGAVFIPITTFHFVSTLLKIKRDKLLFIGYLFGTTIALLIFTPYFISGVRSVDIFPYWGIPGPIYYVFLAYFFTYAMLSIVTPLKCYRKASSANKNKIKYIVIALIAGYLGGSTNYFLFFKIPIPPYLNLLLTIYIGILAYTIIAHKLLDINIVFKKTVIYSVIVSTLLALYISTIFILEHIFRNYYKYHSISFSLFILCFFLFLFNPIKNKIQYLLDKYFFHGSISQIDEENIKLRNELQRAEKLKAISTLAAGMAHEIKNPLTSIKTFSEFLPARHNDPVFLEKFCRIVPAEVDKINNIVRQLLEFSKPASLNIRRTDVNLLINETCEFLNNDFLRKNISVERHLSDLPRINADPVQLKQAFLNLLLNAKDAIRPPGSIVIRTGKEGTKVFVEISDTGTGIEKEDLKRIFDPFFSRKDEGSGLGLSVVHGIIEKHEGSVKVSSTKEGASFRIELPAGDQT
ncbi:MAG: hypothetical protein GF408_08415 [Candidatus Omnitrophica bacterium]|nr:hypothetical protein [Candidatus Omnitrophota bacterium]